MRSRDPDFSEPPIYREGPYTDAQRYVISCTRFSSVNQVYGFAKLCHERGVTVHFVAEPYLDIGYGKQWRPAVANAIRGMAESEFKAKARMAQGFRMSNEQWDYAYQCLEMMNLIFEHLRSEE